MELFESDKVELEPPQNPGRFSLPEETGQIELMEDAQDWLEKALMVDMIGSLLGYMPNFTVGSSVVSPTVETTWGSSNLMSALSLFSHGFRGNASQDSTSSNQDSILGQWTRRAEDWALQQQLALKELEQIDAQITAAEIRIQLAERELATHDRQIEQAAAVEEFLRDKFTNQELYAWMRGRIAGIFFQTYKLAYDQAKRAEKALRYEHGLASTNHIKFGYWDSLRQGLLAGEQLHHDLKRLEQAHLDQNRRHYELTRHISLLQLDPLALIALRTTGRCTFALPEALFDMDCPGHYFQRIKTVAVSIPCVTGPYTSVNCTLTLLKSRVRTSATPGGGYERNENGDDTRFRDDFGSLQSIVTSSAQNDSGLFETNLRDERYLPFEGAGAISEWRLELPNEYRQFDYDTISDVILHLRYTACEGGGALRTAAAAWVGEQVEKAAAAGSVRFLSMRHDFPSEWARFKAAPMGDEQNEATLSITLKEEHYPFWARAVSDKSLQEVWIYVAPAEKPSGPITVRLPVDGSEEIQASLQALGSSFGNLLGGSFGDTLPPVLGQWTLHLTDNSIDDLWLVIKWGGRIADTVSR
ncbi:MAG: hypothetical protein R6W74_05850 [Nitrosomonas halophila]